MQQTPQSPDTPPPVDDPPGDEAPLFGYTSFGRFLRRPAVVILVSAAITGLVAFWPWIASATTGREVSTSASTHVRGWAVAFAAVWGGTECLLGARPHGHDGRSRAWSLVGVGALIWASGAAVAAWSGVAPVGGTMQSGWVQTVQLLGAASILVGSLLVPSYNPPNLQSRIDLSLVLMAAVVSLWAVAVPLVVDGTPDTPLRAATALGGAAWIVSGIALIVRAAPQHNTQLRGLVWTLLAGGLASMMASGPPASMGSEVPRSTDLLWLTGGLALAAAGRRLRRPWVDSSEVRRAADRVNAWFPAVATFMALAIVAVVQRISGEIDPVMMGLGIVVVALSSARGLVMHNRNRALFTRLMRVADDLARTSRTDELTGLGNRLGLEERLGRALRSQPTEGVSVFFIDIDNFKAVNDGLGHDAGDELLRMLAERLVGVLGPDVYRVGGDEFVAVREDLDPQAAEVIAGAAVAALGPPVSIASHRVPTGASVGMARSEVRLDGERRPDDAHLLLRRADLALYRAKELGRGQWAKYEPWLQERADRRLALQQGLREAIDGNQIEVFYQPVVSLRDGDLVGAEALVRWVSPTFGVLLPHEFVPLANEAALMPAIGAQVLRTVVAHLAGSPDCRLWVAINMSNDEIMHPGASQELGRALSEEGVDPSRLRVEVTERTVLDPEARAVLDELAGLGVRICIEDFGSGPTSLRHLSRFSALTLKLDRSFLGSVGQVHRGDSTVLAAVVDLSHELGLGVAAEAITTARQAAELRDLGVDEGQGWYFGQAVRWSELIRAEAAPGDRG